MLGKLVLCAVVCLTLNQVCLARPQQNTADNGEVASLFTEKLSRISACAESLQQIVQAIFVVASHLGQLILEVLTAPIEAVKCVVSSNFLQCEQKVVGATVDEIIRVLSNIAVAVEDLGGQVKGGLKSCILSADSMGYELFLNGKGNFLKVIF